MILLLLCLFLSQRVLAIKYALDANRVRCIAAHVGPHSFVSGLVKMSPSSGQSANAYIQDEARTRIWEKYGIQEETRYSFRSADKASYYELCVESVSTIPGSWPARDVEVYIEVGYDLFDPQRAHDLKVRPVENDIVQLQGAISLITKEFERLVQGESFLRDTNESTNNRLTFFFVCSVISLFVLGGWQIVYMKRYFKSKKLID